MAFDLQRALVEGLGSRIPFLDRLLSYCYFAEMSVLEVASSDSRGRGVSLVGRVGPEGPEEVVLVSPLPSQASRRGLLEDPQDQRRALRLLAATWAMASLQRPGRPGPGIAVIAAHPDPDGEALAGLARERDLLRPRRVVLLDDSPMEDSPGPLAEPVSLDGLIVHLSAPLPVQPLPRPLRDIQVWRWEGGRGPLFRALEDVFSLHQEGRIVPLLVHPRSGDLLEEPLDAEMTVGLAVGGIEPPPSWRHVDSPMRVQTLGSWSHRMQALSQGVALVTQAVRQAWNGAFPDGAIRVVGIASRDPVGIDLLIWVPSGTLDRAKTALEALPGRDQATLSFSLARRSASGSSRTGPDLRLPPGMTLAIPEGIPVAVLGSRRTPEPDAIQEAVLLAGDLKALLEGLPGSLEGRP